MYVLTRYVAWEVLKVFLAALIGLTLMVTLGMAFKEGLNRGLPPLVMLRTMPTSLPEMLGITIPVAMLYAVSSVFGRMTGTNEVVALKSLGVNPMVLIWPVLVLACFLSLGTVWMYEIAATRCRPDREKIIAESLEAIIYGVLRTNQSLQDDRLPVSITVKAVVGHKLMSPVIVFKGQPGHPPITITAEEAELSTDYSDPTGPVLWITYQNYTIDTGGVTYSDPGTERYSISLAPTAPDRYHRDWIAMKDIPTAIAELDVEIEGLHKQRQVAEMYQKANKLIGILDPRASVAAIDKQIDDRVRRYHRLRTEPFRRWSNGFTCLCFALIGVPVAMLWRHADGLTNFFVCFLPILSLYYPLLMLGEDLTISGTLPPYFFWMGNVVLTVPAIALLRWVNRH